jgi:predicted branched-subunit amino acid permease
VSEQQPQRPWQAAPPHEPEEAVWRHPEFRQGAQDMLGTALGVAAWGLITGVSMGNSGLHPAVMVLMSLLVYAGSAQLAVLPLMSSGAPIWVVWATALCVNLRFLIFSVQLRPYFIHRTWRERLALAHVTADLNHVLFMRRFPQPQPSPAHWPYAWGGAVTCWVAWQLPSIAGIFLADVVPVHWGLGFAGVLALLGLVCSLLTGRVSAVAAVVAGCAAVAAYALPLKLNIVVAIAAAVAVGFLIEGGTRQPRPAGQTGPVDPSDRVGLAPPTGAAASPARKD